MGDIWKLSAVEQAFGIRTGQFSAVEAVEASVKRMRATNGAVNAITVDLGDEALATARQADAARASGAALPPLHGVPITVKHNVDVKGKANVNGVPAYVNNIAPDDSAVVSNLRKAGAVIIGLTNTPEFSMRGVTENPVFGRTENPWDSAITVGGSSGGAAAAVVMGMGAVAHGNDIGGSLRWPAYANGLATIKVTQGRIPAFNPSAPSERPLLAQLMSGQGPIARTVADARLGLHAMAARDVRDPWWSPAPLEGPALPRPIKVAVAEIPKGFDADPAVVKAVDDAARMLKDAGYVTERVAAPDLTRPLELWAKLLSAEMRTLQSFMVDLGSDAMKTSLNGLFAVAGDCDMATYMAGLAERTRHMRDWLVFMETYPVVLTPLGLVPSLSPTCDQSEGGFGSLLNISLFQTGYNFLSLPSAVVPTGLHQGRPIGVQLMASRYREDVALAAAEVIEARVGVLAHQLWAKRG